MGYLVQVIVSGIDAGELGHPTPCPGYDVAGLIDHLVEAGRRAAALGRGQAPPPGDESPHVELSDAPGQLRNAAQEAARAWGDTTSLSLRHAMPWGEQYKGAALVDMYLAELAAHAWDLARATRRRLPDHPICRLHRAPPSSANPVASTTGAMYVSRASVRAEEPQARLKISHLLGASPAHSADYCR
jgi:uncharacterized protein (TIGR03086 family)